MFEFATGPSIWAESEQVVLTDDFLHMAILTSWAMSTEAAVVPGAVSYLCLAVQMQKVALFVATLAELTVEVALGHFIHIVFMQEFAFVSFFA